MKIIVEIDIPESTKEIRPELIKTALEYYYPTRFKITVTEVKPHMVQFTTNKLER